ncbi:MAG TPA: hypothetical protein VKA31_00845 [Mariprofundaceae bacterium]|nr:hypothetical protein [Mariprofundaceae bacterium]
MNVTSRGEMWAEFNIDDGTRHGRGGMEIVATWLNVGAKASVVMPLCLLERY